MIAFPSGVGHFAVQVAARALGAGRIISSGSTPQSIALARQPGAHHVFDYKRDEIPAEIAKLTGGRGVDLVFDATYSEAGFVETAKTVRQGGRWIMLGVGPGKTTRLVETHSPVDSILAERGTRERGQSTNLDRNPLTLQFGVNARQVRIEYPGAVYHEMARGDCREGIFTDEKVREMLLRTLSSGLRQERSASTPPAR